ncbi:Beta-phosphoglucomutase [Spironucleus salmonicida]|uniref:Beta-phosphoglucomutase n=1 Tax=Spironucleus salmonicida TaxID=348837 RepID=V6LD60_9EUKA|nr:Beta-phosphoglucomutase [Spironucleus salmonicida]|eukprot:EST42412.1 Hydrolase, haloacid dehalogenase-like family [Spironucleus salmonicida]
MDFLKSADFFVFDFDGTLFDTVGKASQIDRELLHMHGVPDFDRKAVEEEINGLSCAAYMAYLRAKFTLAADVPTLQADLFAIVARVYPACSFVRGALPLLALLKARGKKVGIATAAGREMLEIVFQHFPQFARLVDCLVTCEEAGASKPDPAVYLRCLEGLGGQVSRAVVFEDTVAGLRGARASGMFVVGVISDSANSAAKAALSDCSGTDLEWVCEFMGCE